MAVPGLEVTQMDLAHRELARYPSIRAAAQASGVRADEISRACRGLLVQAGGFFWCYPNDMTQEEAHREMYRNRRGVPTRGPSETQRKAVQHAVCQYTAGMEFVAEYPSLKEAAAHIGNVVGLHKLVLPWQA